jgi:hypothetical protein
MEVINIGDRNAKKRKQDLLEIIDDLRARVEAGTVDEFIAVSTDADGEVQLHACVMDTIGGVGLLEIGKHIVISQSA